MFRLLLAGSALVFLGAGCFGFGDSGTSGKKAPQCRDECNDGYCNEFLEDLEGACRESLETCPVDCGGAPPPEEPPPDYEPPTCVSHGSCRNGEFCPEGTECSGLPAYGCYPIGCPTPICLAKGTQIATPDGSVAVEDLRRGMSVWTTDRTGQRVEGTIERTSMVRPPARHQVIRIRLEDDRVLRVSPGHPTADGRTVDQLRVGDRLDGVRIVSLRKELYEDDTYDLMPSGGTGAYWAEGILLRSSLQP